MANKQNRTIPAKGLDPAQSIISTKIATVFADRCTNRIDRAAYSKQDYSNLINQFRHTALAIDVAANPTQGLLFFNSLILIV